MLVPTRIRRAARALVWVAWFPGCAIDPPPPGGELDAREAFIARRVERVRGHSFPSDVELAIRERSEFREDIRTDGDGEKTDTEDFLEATLKSFGLVPEEGDAASDIEDLMGEAIQGVYEPKQRRLTVVLDEGGQSREGTFSHEIVHAIDDGAFDIERMLALGDDGDVDAWLARRAVVEGSATLHQFEYVLLRSGVDASSLLQTWQIWSRYARVLDGGAAGLLAGSGEKRDDAVASAPPVLIGVIIMPYVAGARFLNEVKRRHGVAGVDAVFEDPPKSTEQILHPERYFADRQEPLTIELPRISSRLPHLECERHGTFGEFLIRFLLRDDDGDLWPPHLFKGLADPGWAGDRFAVARDGTHRVVLWRTEWDSVSDARRFHRRVSDWLERRAAIAMDRAGGRRVHSSRRDGRSVCVVSGAKADDEEAAYAALFEAEVHCADGKASHPLSAALAFAGELLFRARGMADGSVRYEVLRGLLAAFEDRPRGFELSLLFGGAMHIQKTPDRILAGTAFDLVNVRRNARHGTGSVTLLGLFDPSWSDDAFALDLALQFVSYRTARTVDADVSALNAVPGVGFAFDRAVAMAYDDETGERMPEYVARTHFDLALQSVRYDRAARSREESGSRFALLWGVLFGRRTYPSGSEWWTPLIGYERRGDDGFPTLLWGFLELR